MGFGDFRSIGSQSEGTSGIFKQEAAETAQELSVEQKAADKAAQAENAENVFRPKTERKEKKIKAHSSRINKMMKAKEGAGRLLPVEQIKDQAQRFQQRNPELKAKVLQHLRELIKPGDSKEEILEKVKNFFPDPSLADEVMEFLLETTDGELHNQVKEAKDEFLEKNEREIIAGRNISQEARAASEKGLGTPTSLRDMYRDITGNPRDASTLFEELSQKFAFKELKKVVDFMLHSLGADMKSKGPSISRGELHRLFTETRTMQAILGVYRFFQGRMGLVKGLFEQNGIPMPKELSFENMAKAFMSLAGERYPSQDKVFSQARRLGIEDWLLAKIIAFSQFRDSIRELAMNQIFRSLQHRDDLYLAIIEALEDLEDEFEEEEEKKREQEEEE
jgi:type III secretion protein W